MNRPHYLGMLPDFHAHAAPHHPGVSTAPRSAIPIPPFPEAPCVPC